VPECQKIENGGLDQYDLEHFDTAGLERVKHYGTYRCCGFNELTIARAMDGRVVRCDAISSCQLAGRLTSAAVPGVGLL